MTTMKTLLAAMLIAAPLTLPAYAQEPSPATDQYEFIIAKLASSEGRFDEALSRLEKLLAKEPNSAVLQFEHAMVLIDASRLDRAEAELRKVTAANPDFYDAHRVLGRLLLDSAGTDREKLNGALAELRTAFKLNPNDLSTGATVAQILVASNRLDEAEKVLATLVERAPDQRSLNFTYAQVLTKLGRPADAKQYLERVVLLEPTFAPAVFQLMDSYQKEGDFSRAAELLRPMIEEDPSNLDLQRQQALFYLRAGENEEARDAFRKLVAANEKDSRSLFYLAESLNDLGQLEEADKIYSKLLAATPRDPELLTSYALNLTAQKRYDDAVRTFRSLLGLPDLPENLKILARTQLALIDFQRENYDAAQLGARSVLVYGDTPNHQAINIAIESLRKQNRAADAVALLEPLASRFTADPYVNAAYVETLARAGQPDQARAAALAQVKAGTRNAVTAAEAFVRADQFEPAIAVMNAAAQTYPDDIDVLFELGSVQERAGNHAAAEKAFLSILQKHPDHAATLNYLGYMWADRGVNLERAADMLTRAVTQEPRNGAYLDSLGWAYFRLGKLDLAEKQLTDATQLLPRDATVFEHLADVLAKRGNTTRALDVYRNALTMDPEEKTATSIRAKIATLEKQQPSTRR